VATNVYNGTAADLEPVAKGAKFYRIRAAGKSYAANAFNPSPKPLHDPEQGRFEPTDPALGGYLYVAPTLPGAVAEGILRNQPVPSSRLVPRAWLVHKMLAVMTLDEDIAVAAAYGRHAAKLNLDASFLCDDSSAYSATRSTGTEILLNTPTARALAYPCRNYPSEIALMPITRGGTPVISVDSEVEIMRDPVAARLIVDTLDHVFGLKYAGAMP
jgi:RES domain